MGLLGESPKRWLAHVCVHPGCDHIEIDGSCNHGDYLCYASEVHKPGALPLRPVFVVLAPVQPETDEARQIRSRTTEWTDEEYGFISNWRRPSQHFERGGDGVTLLTDPVSDDEDWPGWPDVDVPAALQIERTSKPVPQ